MNIGDIVRAYLDEYIDYIDKQLKENVTNKMIDDHLIKISFFSHERLIHLLVTLFYGVFLFLSILIGLEIPLFLFISLILIVFLIFYVRHYFLLENGVQYLYKQYDKMKEKLSK